MYLHDLNLHGHFNNDWAIKNRVYIIAENNTPKIGVIWCYHYL